MLSNKELQVFLSQPQKYKKRAKPKSLYHLVFELTTGRILYASRNPYTIKKVAEFAINTASHIDISTKQFSDLFDVVRPYNYIFERSGVDTNNPKLKGKSRISKLDLWPDDTDFYYYALIAEKAMAIDFIISEVSALRRRNYNGLALQYQVYDMKVKEAEEIIKQDISELDDDTYFEFPFVHSYADIENFNLREAAEEIMLHHSFFKSWLASVEALRLKYNKLVIQETDIRKIPEIIVEFMNQGRPYGQL
jgi:hypothetical protein